MLIKSVKLTNFLSFGESAGVEDLLPLNVLIGPNGSGKSNLIGAIELLRSAPRDLLTPIRNGGGVRDWLWKGAPQSAAPTIDVVIENPRGQVNLRYELSFTEVAQRFEIISERVETEVPYKSHDRPCFFLSV